MKLKQYTEFLNEGVEATNPMAALFVKLLWTRDQAHIFHWQTKSFAQHEALGEFYEGFIEMADELAETIMGKRGRFSMGTLGATITLEDYSDIALQGYITECCNFFEEEITTIISPEENDAIYNIVDDIKTALNKIKYLITLS